MARVMMPYDGKSPVIAPSLVKHDKQADNDVFKYNDNDAQINIAAEKIPNPTVIPAAILKEFHVTFLIRHPRLSVPSFYRFFTPALSPITGFSGYKSRDAGFKELRRLFDYLKDVEMIGPCIAGRNCTDEFIKDAKIGQGNIEICLVDAEDLLENAAGVMEAYCKSIGVAFNDGMLDWNSPRCRQEAERQLGKKGFTLFHDEALASTTLKRTINVSFPGSPMSLDAWSWWRMIEADGNFPAEVERKIDYRR